MALYPANVQLATWLGTGANNVSPATAANGFYIPAANVSTYVGSGGADASVTNDIRDFLFSVLSKAYDTYTTVPAGDTAATDVIIGRVLDTANGTISFVVTLKDATIVKPYVSAFGTYS